MSGFKRGDIILPILEKGHKHLTISTLWQAFIGDKEIALNNNDKTLLKRIQTDIKTKWKNKNCGSLSKFKQRYLVWLEQEFSCSEIPECLINDENKSPRQILQPVPTDTATGMVKAVKNLVCKTKKN